MQVSIHYSHNKIPTHLFQKNLSDIYGVDLPVATFTPSPIITEIEDLQSVVLQLQDITQDEWTPYQQLDEYSLEGREITAYLGGVKNIETLKKFVHDTILIKISIYSIIRDEDETHHFQYNLDKWLHLVREKMVECKVKPFEERNFLESCREKFRDVDQEIFVHYSMVIKAGNLNQWKDVKIEQLSKVLDKFPSIRR